MILVTVSIASIIIISGFMLLGTTKDEARLVVRMGDEFDYSVSGNNNGTIVEGTMNLSELGGFSILGATSGVTAFARTTGLIWNEDSFSEWVCDHSITTIWGNKTVSMYLHHYQEDNGNQCMVLTDVGIDSQLIYRSDYFTPEILVTCSLSGTNNTDVPTADERPSEAASTGVGSPSEIPTRYQITNGSGFSTYGSLEISSGQQLNYNLTGAGGYVMIFSTKDLVDMDNDGVMHYCQKSSLIGDHPGQIDIALDEGTYWFYAAVENSPEDVSLTYFW